MKKVGKVVTIGEKSDSDHPKVNFCDQKCPEKTKKMTFFDQKIIKHCHQKWVRAQYHWGFQKNIFYNFYLQY